VDSKINGIQTQLPQREVDLKLAMYRLSQDAAQSDTGAVQNASAKDAAKKKHAAKPELTPPWYSRFWKWIHG